jgi:transposase
VINGSDDATALVWMRELVVGAQVLRDGEWWLAVETTADRAWCPSCAVRAVGHGRSRVLVRDLPIAGTPTVLVFARRRWRCGEELCRVRTWSEHVEAIASTCSDHVETGHSTSPQRHRRRANTSTVGTPAIGRSRTWVR